MTPAPSLSPSSYASDPLLGVSVVENQVVGSRLLQKDLEIRAEKDASEDTILKFSRRGTALSTRFDVFILETHTSKEAAPELEHSYRFSFQAIARFA